MIRTVRHWTSHLAFARSAWAYAVVLLLAPLCAALIDVVREITTGRTARISGIPLWLWLLIVNGFGLFLAGMSGHALSKSKFADRFGRLVLLIGAVFVLTFPFAATMAIAWRVADEVRMHGTTFSTAYDLLGYFGSYWWGLYRAYGAQHLVWIVVWSTISTLLLETADGGNGPKSASAFAAAAPRSVRPWHIVIGSVAIVLGAAVAVPDSLLPFTGQTLNVSLSTWWDAVRALPLLFVGVLLVLPARRPA